MRRRLAWLVAVLVAVVAVGGCQPPKPEWADIPPSPGAQSYEGALETPLDNRVAGRIAERGLRILDSRLERLPAGVTWEQHLKFRDANADGMRRRDERVPEPDAPVRYAEWSGADRTLFVVGAADTEGRLVVLTALAEPR